MNRRGQFPRQGPHRLSDARHPGRGLAHLLRERDGQDPRHRPPPELADLLGRVRQDSAARRSSSACWTSSLSLVRSCSSRCPSWGWSPSRSSSSRAAPALFRQPRLGQNGRVFILNKFRSMREDAEKDTGPVWAQEHDPRVTRVGALPPQDPPGRAAAALQRPPRRHELHRTPAGAARVRLRAPEADSLLHGAPVREAGHHGLGAGAVSATAPPSRTRSRSSSTTSTTSRTCRCFWTS